MSFVQLWGDDTVTATSGSPVTSGNVVCGIVAWNNQTSTLTTLANDRGPNCTLTLNPTEMSLNAMRAMLFYGALTSSGTCTLTMTFAGGTPSISMIIVHEYSGIDTAQIVDNAGAARALQEAYGAGSGGGVTDFYSSGTFTTVTNGCTIVGFMVDPNLNDDMVSGTGFTDRNTTQTANIRGDSEDRVQTTAGSAAATFTCPSHFRAAFAGGIGLKPAGATITYFPSSFGE